MTPQSGGEGNGTILKVKSRSWPHYHVSILFCYLSTMLSMIPYFICILRLEGIQVHLTNGITHLCSMILALGTSFQNWASSGEPAPALCSISAAMTRNRSCGEAWNPARRIHTSRAQSRLQKNSLLLIHSE